MDVSKTLTTARREVCESRGECSQLPVPSKPTVSVDVKQNFNNSSAGGV